MGDPLQILKYLCEILALNWEIVVGVTGILGFALTVWIESRPHAEELETQRYIDYSQGIEISHSRYKFCLGRCPLLNRVLWRRKRIGIVKFFDSSITLTLEAPLERKTLELGKEWERKVTESGIEVAMKRTAGLALSDVYSVVLEACRERGRGFIQQKVTNRFEEREWNGKTTVVASVDNRCDVAIRNYELGYVVHSLEGLTTPYVRPLGGKGQTLDERDFAVRLEVPLPYLSMMKRKRFNERKDFRVIATVDIDPGLTSLEFQYNSP